MASQTQVKEAMPDKRAHPEPQQLYGRSLFDPELRTSRKLLISTLLLPILYTSILMWACLSLYWGSTTYTSLQKLTIHAIDLDGGIFGHQMIAGLKKSAQNSREGLDWRFDVDVGSAGEAQRLVLDETVWAAVESMLRTQHLRASPLTLYSRSIYHVLSRNSIALRSLYLQSLVCRDNLHRISTKSDHDEFEGCPSHTRDCKPTTRAARC